MWDRLRAVQCPSDIVDQIGGWTTDGVGQGYGSGYPIEVLIAYYSGNAFKIINRYLFNQKLWAGIELNCLIVWSTKGFSDIFTCSCGENGYCVVQLAILMLAMLIILESWITIATGELE